METRIINKIGLEGEFFLQDKKGDFVFPGEYGFETDEFPLLGEFRCKPGSSRQEVVGNFFAELDGIYGKAIEKNLWIKFNHFSIPIELKREALKKMGVKQIADTKNIYGKSILDYSDDVVVDGKVVATTISAGLHIHFSKEVVATQTDSNGLRFESSSYILTEKDKKSIIRYMDNKVYPLYPADSISPLKYRLKGYYEDKSYGFEYRSLPMLQRFLDFTVVSSLVLSCFKALESI
jgi:hypothetical protein